MIDYEKTMECFENEMNNVHNNDDPMSSLQVEIECCQNFIPKFFSQCDLDCNSNDGIRYMYNYIHDNIDSDNTVDAVSVRHAYHVYREYLDGMLKFIYEIINFKGTPDTDFINLYRDRLNNAIEKDEEFIKSLFNGCELNERKCMKLDEATDNIEFLVDFFEDAESMSTLCDELKKHITDNSDILKNSIILLSSSINRFCKMLIGCVISTYIMILKSIKGSSVVTPPVDKFSAYKLV